MTREFPDIPSDLLLDATDAGLELRFQSARPGEGVRADLASSRLEGHPLGKALKGCDGMVIDATAGLGGDTAVLAGLGRTVLALERNPVLHALLLDAHERMEDRELADRITIIHADAREYLVNHVVGDPAVAAVVLDPMFPVRRRESALPGKPMQVLRTLLAGEPPDDQGALFRAAQATGPRRIILKRPPEAPALECVRAPTFSLETKLVRWDVWERPRDEVQSPDA